MAKHGIGTIVPISTGQMRNDWFPRRVAEYVTVPELKTLRLKNIAVHRDFDYGVEDLLHEAPKTPAVPDVPSDAKTMSDTELKSASAFQKAKAPEIQRLTPDRSTELVEIFVPPRLEFYRQPIIEEKEPEKPEPDTKKLRFGGAAGDLLAARTALTAKEKMKPQAIYGSVTTQDILVAVRATMGSNDEAARVVLQEHDIHFVDLPDIEGAEAGRVKHLGDFTYDIRVKGSETTVRRVVRVLPQEAA